MMMMPTQGRRNRLTIWTVSKVNETNDAWLSNVLNLKNVCYIVSDCPYLDDGPRSDRVE